MNIILRCVVATCLMLFSVSALADDNRRSQGFVMFDASTLNVGLMQLQFNDPLDPNDDTIEPISMIEGRSLGTLGRADATTFSKVTDEPALPHECRDGFPIPLVVTDDTLVLTFHDLSQLVGSVRTVVCMTPDGTQGVRGEGHWTSGKGRFANVTGGEIRVSSTATPQSTNRQFYSGAGVISGRIERR